MNEYTITKTIEELKQWYAEMQLPPEEVTRFFIDKNITEPKAFSIYKDGLDFIVYKNKRDGSRTIRYQGTDEAYAVKELQNRIIQEILNQEIKTNGVDPNELMTINEIDQMRDQQSHENPIREQQRLEYKQKIENEQKKHNKWNNVISIFSQIMAIFFFIYTIILSKSDYVSSLSFGIWIISLIAVVFYVVLCVNLISQKDLLFKKFIIFLMIFMMTLSVFCAIADKRVLNKSYKYYYVPETNNVYYRQLKEWYIYDDKTNTWSQTNDIPPILKSSNYQDYIYYEFNGLTFEDTEFSHEPNNTLKYIFSIFDSSSSDDSYSYDNDDSWYDDDWGGGWNSDDTDWDSDW